MGRLASSSSEAVGGVPTAGSIAGPDASPGRGLVAGGGAARGALWATLVAGLGAAAIAAVVWAPAGGSTAAAMPPGAAPRHGSAPADTGLVTLRLPADGDATVDSGRPGTPLGATRALTVGHALGAGRASSRTLLHFSLPELPAGSTIVSATLVLDTVAVQGQAEVALNMSPIVAPWREADVTWTSRPAVADNRSWRLTGPELGPLALDALWVVDYWQAAGGPPDGLALWVAETECDAGRSRAFASREAGPVGGEPPTLWIVYVGPGTPHPFPSNTPTASPTRTATPTGTLPLTPTPTTTSTFGQWQGQAQAVRPSDGAHLAQPLGGEEWVFEWYPPNRGPCAYNGADLTLVAPDGSTIARTATGTCYRFTFDRPVLAGRWQWSVQARCAHGPSTPSERRAFIVAAAPATPTPWTPTPRPTVPPTVTATAAPLHLPYAGQVGAMGGTGQGRRQ